VATSASPAGGPRSLFLWEMRRAILRDLEPEITLALKVGVLMAAGHRRAVIAERTGATPAELRVAVARVKRAVPALDTPDT